MSKSFVIDDFLVGLKIFGINPKFNGTKEFVKSVLAFLYITFFLVSLLYSFTRCANYSDFAESVEATATVWQVIPYNIA